MNSVLESHDNDDDDDDDNSVKWIHCVSLTELTKPNQPTIFINVELVTTPSLSLSLSLHIYLSIFFLNDMDIELWLVNEWWPLFIKFDHPIIIIKLRCLLQFVASIINILFILLLLIIWLVRMTILFFFNNSLLWWLIITTTENKKFEYQIKQNPKKWIRETPFT